MTLELPQGFVYQPDLLSESEEQALLRRVRAIDFGEVKMRGMVARRRVAHFGWLYNYESWKIEPGAAVPDFLTDVRERAAALLGVEAGQLAQVLVTEYSPGAGIGWHRDAPPFGAVVAVSLLSSCRLRLRYGSSGRTGVTLEVEPRSAYVLSGAARSAWQHSIQPAKHRVIRLPSARCVPLRAASARGRPVKAVQQVQVVAHRSGSLHGGRLTAQTVGGCRKQNQRLDCET